MAESSRIESRAEIQRPKTVYVGTPPYCRDAQSYTAVGQTFRVGDIFPQEQASPWQGDAFSSIYFKTASGNVYKIGDDGRIIDSRSSKEQEKTIAIPLTREELAERVLRVHEPFTMPGIIQTTPIEEIVTVSDRVRGGKPDHIPHSNIVDIFENNLSFLDKPLNRK